MSSAPTGSTQGWAVLIATKRTAVALERRADALLRARALTLTQLRLLLDVDERHTTYPNQLAGDLLISRQATHHHLATLAARGAVSLGSEGRPVRTVSLTPEGRHLTSRGIADLALLLDRVAHPNLHTILPMITRLAAAASDPLPRWDL